MAETILLTNVSGSEYLEAAVNADRSRSVELIPDLSPREKRKVLLQILNPTPNRETGVVHARISLYHAERYERRHNGAGHPMAIIDRERLTVFFNREGIERVDAGERLFLRRVHNTPAFSVRPLPPEMSNETGTQLWPTLPVYSGRALEDYLESKWRDRGKR